MKALLAMIAVSIPLLIGCSDNLSPLSPDLINRIDNQNGKIDDIQNNQNGVMLELGKIKSEQKIMAENIGNLQQGLINKNNENFGVQVFQGDGGLIAFFSLAVITLMLIYHYKSKSDKNEQMAEIFAQQVALYNDVNLDNGVFMASMNTNVEKDLYHLMVKHQQTGH